MAVEVTRPTYGPIEPLTLAVLREELEKLRGTLADDTVIQPERCTQVCDEFIDELGACINISMVTYPDDKDLYISTFDGLQDVINLMHGVKDGLVGSDGQVRMMDPQESRLTAADRLTEITDHLAFQVSQREVSREMARMEKATPPGESRRRPPREVASSP